MKKDAVIEALQLIKTSDFTELKTIRAPVSVVQKVVIYTGQLLIDKSCDFRRGLQELICKPKVFIELSLGLEDRLEAQQLQLLRLYRKEEIDLGYVGKTSRSALGLASWLNALSEFTHYTGLQKKAKFVPTQKKQTGSSSKQEWQYHTNADQVD